MNPEVYYLDTSILLDIYETRGINGRYALAFLKQAIRRKAIFLYSDFHIKELKGLYYAIHDILGILRIFRQQLRHVHIASEQREEATNLASRRGLPKGDALHAILARDNDALLVSRDRDFERLRDIIETRKPEDIY